MSDRVGALPGMDQRMDDVRAVMDAVGIQRAALWGMSADMPYSPFPKPWPYVFISVLVTMRSSRRFRLLIQVA